MSLKILQELMTFKALQMHEKNTLDASTMVLPKDCIKQFGTKEARQVLEDTYKQR